MTLEVPKEELVNGDEIYVTGTASFEDAGVGENKEVTVKVTGYDGEQKDWYNVNAPKNVTGTILPRDTERKPSGGSSGGSFASHSFGSTGGPGAESGGTWIMDTDGHIYYLHPIGDGTRGRMYTGWNLIDRNWYYFNTVSDGTRGALFVNCQLPDGYRVDEKGVWIP